MTYKPAHLYVATSWRDGIAGWAALLTVTGSDKSRLWYDTCADDTAHMGEMVAIDTALAPLRKGSTVTIHCTAGIKSWLTLDWRAKRGGIVEYVGRILGRISYQQLTVTYDLLRVGPEITQVENAAKLARNTYEQQQRDKPPVVDIEPPSNELPPL